jgi:hypothetical protein
VTAHTIPARTSACIDIDTIWTGDGGADDATIDADAVTNDVVPCATDDAAF